MFTFNGTIITLLRLPLWRVHMFFASPIVFITTNKSLGTLYRVLRVHPLISGDGLRVSKNIGMVWRVAMPLGGLHFILHLNRLMIGVRGLRNLNMGHIHRPTSPVLVRFPMKGALLNHLQNVHPGPNRGTTFFQQLIENDFVSTFYYINPNLFYLPSIPLRAFFLNLLLFYF